MVGKFDCEGVLILEPESQVEAYAAEVWLRDLVKEIKENSQLPIVISFRPERLID